jgi:hypothetical protein
LESCGGIVQARVINLEALIGLRNSDDALYLGFEGVHRHERVQAKVENAVCSVDWHTVGDIGPLALLDIRFTFAAVVTPLTCRQQPLLGKPPFAARLALIKATLALIKEAFTLIKVTLPFLDHWNVLRKRQT